MSLRFQKRNSWSFILPDEYKMHITRIAERPSRLFLDTDTSMQTRFRFWHLVCELFGTFAKRIYSGARKRVLLTVTGFLRNLGDQVTSNGAVCPTTSFSTSPAWTGLQTRRQLPYPRSLVSAANHLAKQILTETLPAAAGTQL